MANFELDAMHGDGTRLLRDRASGYSVTLVGNPTLEPGPEGPVRYDAIAKLADVQIEHGFRIDDLPTTTDPKALAEALAITYSKSRAENPPAVWDIPEEYLPRGAIGGAKAQYRLRGSENDVERVWVATKPSPTGVWALYFTTRANLDEVNPIGWSHLLSTFNGQHRWGDDSPRAPIWPAASELATPIAGLALTESGLAEAEAKARDLVGHHIPDNVIGNLSRLAQTDDPPATAIDAVRLHATQSQLSALVPPETAKILLRDLDRCHTMLDLRGWIWQCVAAIGTVPA
ncbi:MAG: hypothetical protein ACKV2T_38310 [Kofleriaceae bacterium]